MRCLRSVQPFSFSSSSLGFNFSTPGYKTFPRMWTPPPASFSFKHKTPSQRRRDQRRYEQFQEKKNKPAAEEVPQTKATGQETSKNDSPTEVMEPPITSVTDPSPATQSPQVVEPSQTLESEQILESPPELHHHHQDQMEVDLNPLNPLPPPKG